MRPGSPSWAPPGSPCDSFQKKVFLPRRDGDTTRFIAWLPSASKTGNWTNVINTTFGGAAWDTIAFIVPRGTVFPRTFSLPRGIMILSIRPLGARGVSHRLAGVVPVPFRDCWYSLDVLSRHQQAALAAQDDPPNGNQSRLRDTAPADDDGTTIHPGSHPTAPAGRRSSSQSSWHSLKW